MHILNPADLAVDSFEPMPALSSTPLPTTDPTAATRCFYCPPPTLGTDPIYLAGADAF